ncbi:MAG: hypothetical protein ACXIVQ_15225 [Acidimicrobiales bacterium]
MTPTERRIRALVADGALDLPLPATGATAERHHALLQLARVETVGVARLAEAHTDAVAILAAADRPSAPGAVYGVWASERPGAHVHLDTASGTITGTKAFCSGVDLVDRALVTVVDDAERRLLVEVQLDGETATSDTTTDPWSTPALDDTATAAVRFDHHGIAQVVGPPGWYTDRPGFWHGAIGPAACWAGAAVGLADVAEDLTGDDPHRLAHLGAIRALVWGMHAALEQSGREIDADPDDALRARSRALSVRHLVERSASEILDRFGRSLGPRPFTSDPAAARRFADTHLYLRQNHAERDLHALATLPSPR